MEIRNRMILIVNPTNDSMQYIIRDSSDVVYKETFSRFDLALVRYSELTGIIFTIETDA